MPLMDSSPGSFESLPAGMDFKPWDPQHPNQAYDAFVRECLRGVAAGLDVPYHELGQDLASVNFSSIRAGLLDARDTWQLLQQWTIDSLCQPVYAAWLGNAILAGSLNLDPQGIPQYKDGAEWHARGWDWVDPLKDVSADVLAIDNGMTTLTRVLAKRGLDFEEIVNERKRELDRIKELGLTLGADLKGDSGQPANANGPEEDDPPPQSKPNGKANGRFH